MCVYMPVCVCVCVCVCAREREREKKGETDTRSVTTHSEYSKQFTLLTYYIYFSQLLSVIITIENILIHHAESVMIPFLFCIAA